MTLAQKLLPWVILLVFVGWVGSKARPPKPTDGIDFYELGKIPVRDGGRLMPLDTLARTTLQSISGRTEVQNENGDKVSTALEWLVEVLDQPDWDTGAGAKAKIFRIEHPQLLGALELPRRPGFYRYSVDEIRKNFEKLQTEIDKVREKKDKGHALDLYDAKVEDLAKKLSLFQRLNRADQIQPIPPTAPDGDWTTLRSVDEKALQGLSDQDVEAIQERALLRLRDELMSKYGKVENIPPSVADSIRSRMGMITNQLLAEEARKRRGSVSDTAGTFTELIRSARDRNAEKFNAALAKYKEESLQHVDAKERSNAALEAVAMGHLSPFYYCAFLYVVVGVLSAIGWLVWHRSLNQAALYLAIATFLYHTVALCIRMYVQGRPPVTNLYSSAVFIGWGAVGLSLILEVIYKNGIGNAVAGISGAASMQIAHFLGGSGDTMGMLVAVLDTNFWLATHVTVVTLGYTATFVAGFIGAIYILRGVFTTSLDADASKTLTQMMYGVICFALLLSFLGTVLGGIWADYSWGRFWGWDPKENGAVMIVVWNALILHARWGGMVKSRGIAVLSLFGSIITAWSWFGTNQLQIGLHSYGFDNRLATGCRWFWISQLVLIGIGLIPTAYWRSKIHQAKTKTVRGATSA